MFKIFLLLCLTISLQASGWRPSNEFLAALRLVESSNGKNLVGDHGKSLGDFQMSEAAWLDVSSWRKGRGLRVYSFEAHALHPKINRLYAADYLCLLHKELSKELKRPPTPSELYAAYNLGMGTFARCDYKLRKVNPVTAKKCGQIGEFLRRKAG